MANLSSYSALNMAAVNVWYGNVTRANSNQISVSDGYNQAVYYGQFSYNIFDEVFGTLQGYQQYANGRLIYDVTGISADANSVFHAIQYEGDAEKAKQIIFYNNDSITGHSSGSDYLIGYFGNDRIYGLGGNDTLDGGNGDDLLVSGHGNDVLYGGNGIDTAEFRSSFHEVVATKTVAGFQIVSSDGIDVVRGVEYFRFSDRTVSASDLVVVPGLILVGDDGRNVLTGGDGNDHLTGNLGNDVLLGRAGNDFAFGDGAVASYYGADIANQVYRLYQATLDRAPDITGHANWAGRIASDERSLADVADGFVRSPQFKATYSDNVSNTEFVTLLYNNVLGRAPDEGGLARWTGELANGAARAEVVLGFSQSPQFVTATTTAANAFAVSSAAANWSDEVYRLYHATLDRAPDITGQTNWTGRLASGEYSLLEVADGFVRSPQFQATYQNLHDTDFVTLLYNNVLHRTPDDQGLARWVGELQGGASRADVVLGFSQSPQFAANTAPDVKTWMRNQGQHDRIEPGSGDNVVAGGQFADTFVFSADQDGVTGVADLEVWDYIELNGFGYSGTAAARARMSQSGNDVLFADQGVEVIFYNTALTEISYDMILL